MIVAIPIGPRDAVEKLRKIMDELIVLHSPSIFGAVGAFYQNFSQVTVDEVVKIMSKYRTNLISNDS